MLSWRTRCCCQGNKWVQEVIDGGAALLMSTACVRVVLRDEIKISVCCVEEGRDVRVQAAVLKWSFSTCLCFRSVCVWSSVFWICARPQWRHYDKPLFEVDTHTLMNRCDIRIQGLCFSEGIPCYFPWGLAPEDSHLIFASHEALLWDSELLCSHQLQCRCVLIVFTLNQSESISPRLCVCCVLLLNCCCGFVWALKSCLLNLWSPSHHSWYPNPHPIFWRIAFWKEKVIHINQNNYFLYFMIIKTLGEQINKNNILICSYILWPKLGPLFLYTSVWGDLNIHFLMICFNHDSWSFCFSLLFNSNVFSQC